MKSPKRVVVLGATGSIGKSTQAVARALPEGIQLVGLASANNRKELLEAATEFRPEAVCLADANGESGTVQPNWPTGTRVLSGKEGLIEIATLPSADIVLVAIVGTAGLEPALAAIEAGKDLAVASKEILVAAGGLVMDAARKKGVRVLPVDSEHNAIFQCLEGKKPGEVERLHLTCSGGPFRNLPAGEFSQITPAQALRHPTWQMGKKITIDSATLFNKGLEMLEACALFEVGVDRISVVIHPQSIVHSMVEFVDGSVLAQLSGTDMTFPIQYALTYPERRRGPLPRLDLQQLGSLEFSAPREDIFPALRLAREAGRQGGTLPAVFNAANESAVSAFLQKHIRFLDIARHVETAMQQIPFIANPTLEQILDTDRLARELPLPCPPMQL